MGGRGCWSSQGYIAEGDMQRSQVMKGKLHTNYQTLRNWHSFPIILLLLQRLQNSKLQGRCTVLWDGNYCKMEISFHSVYIFKWFCLVLHIWKSSFQISLQQGICYRDKLAYSIHLLFPQGLLPRSHSDCMASCCYQPKSEHSKGT